MGLPTTDRRNCGVNSGGTRVTRRYLEVMPDHCNTAIQALRGRDARTMAPETAK